MMKRILLPLAQADAVPSAIGLVADTARGSGATVRLLHVAPLPRERVTHDGRVVAYANQEMERIEHEHRRDLRTAEALLDGVPVETVVRFGDPAREILIEAEAFGADVIVVPTRRRRWLPQVLRRVAGTLLRKSDVPVLVLADR